MIQFDTLSLGVLIIFCMSIETPVVSRTAIELFTLHADSQAQAQVR